MTEQLKMYGIWCKDAGVERDGGWAHNTTGELIRSQSKGVMAAMLRQMNGDRWHRVVAKINDEGFPEIEDRET